MSYTIKQNLVDASKYNVKCPYTMTAEFFVIHNTANDATAVNEISYMKSNNNEVSFHYAIDEKEVIQGLPLNRNGWHSGDGANGAGNRKGIAIEICYSKTGGEKFVQSEKNTAKFVANELEARGWGIDKVRKHQDFSSKYCPHRTLDAGWQRFIDMIKAEMNATVSAPSQAPTKYVKDYAETGEFFITTGRQRYLCDVPSLTSKELGTVPHSRWIKYNRVVFNDGRIWVWCVVERGWVSTGSYDMKTVKRTESFANFK